MQYNQGLHFKGACGQMANDNSCLVSASGGENIERLLLCPPLGCSNPVGCMKSPACQSGVNG